MATKKVKVIVLISNAAGKYGIPQSRLQVAELESKQATEIIDAGDAVKYSQAALERLTSGKDVDVDEADGDGDQ